MSYSNTVAVISNADFQMQEMKGMLLLLREVDSVECLNYFSAEEYLKEETPEVVILHAAEDDKNVIKLLKKIRKKTAEKSVPIILYADYCSADFIVEAFDCGVTDIINGPLKDYELVIRVIWAIQKSQYALIAKTKENFLARLGIIDEETGFYKPEFSLKYLETVTEQAKQSKHKACLMLAKVKPAIHIGTNKEHLAELLKGVIRINDTIAIKDNESFYLLLSRAKLNGAYSVYERLVSRLNPMTVISASVAEIQDELFDDIINVLDAAIEKAPKNGEISVVQKQDFLDMYIKENENEELEIAKIFGDNELNKKTEDIKFCEPENAKTDENTEDNKENVLSECEKSDKILESEEDKIGLGIKIITEKVKKIGRKNKLKQQPKTRKKVETFDTEESEIDKRNAILSKQAYAKKLELIAGPLFKKYAAKFQNEYLMLDADLSATPEAAFLKLEKDDIKLDFKMSFDGIKMIKFELAVTALGSVIESDELQMAVMEFDHQKLEIILETLAKEYENYLAKD